MKYSVFSLLALTVLSVSACQSERCQWREDAALDLVNVGMADEGSAVMFEVELILPLTGAGNFDEEQPAIVFSGYGTRSYESVDVEGARPVITREIAADSRSVKYTVMYKGVFLNDSEMLINDRIFTINRSGSINVVLRYYPGDVCFLDSGEAFSRDIGLVQVRSL